MPSLADCTLDYIKSRSDVDEETGCWLFRHDRSDRRHAHPQVYIRELKRPVLVRRLSYVAKQKVSLATINHLYIVPNSKCKCGECVNPDHARSLTKKQKDRYSLDRANSKGQFTKALKCALVRRKTANLTLEIVAEIRLVPRGRGKGMVTDTEMTRQLNARGIKCCRKAVSEARQGHTWKEYGGVFHALRIAA